MKKGKIRKLNCPSCSRPVKKKGQCDRCRKATRRRLKNR